MFEAIEMRTAWRIPPIRRTAILNRNIDPGLSQAHIYWVLVAVLAIIAVPLVYAVPDFEGRW